MIRIELSDGSIRQEQDADFSLSQDACGALSLYRRSGMEPSGHMIHALYGRPAWVRAWWDRMEFIAPSVTA